MIAGDDLDQRRFAGAVLTDQRMDLAARTARSTDESTRMPAKLLVKPAKFKERGAFRHRLTLPSLARWPISGPKACLYCAAKSPPNSSFSSFETSLRLSATNRRNGNLLVDRLAGRACRARPRRARPSRATSPARRRPRPGRLTLADPVQIAGDRVGADDLDGLVEVRRLDRGHDVDRLRVIGRQHESDVRAAPQQRLRELAEFHAEIADLGVLHSDLAIGTERRKFLLHAFDA